MSLKFFKALLLLSVAMATGCSKFLPEDQRDLNYCIIGLKAADRKYLILNELHPAGKAPEEFNKFNRELYKLEFQTEHGDLLAVLPQNTRLCVALPSKAGGGSGEEKEFFKDYLKDYLHWTTGEINRRILFFEVPTELVWTQDFGELVGRNWMGRRLLRVGGDDQQAYRDFAQALTDGLPSIFAMNYLPPFISAEGGDIATLRFPDGRTGLVLGRHRVLDYLRLSGHGVYGNGAQVPMELIEEARAAYETAYGLPAMVVPKEPLLKGWVGDELFHLDMGAAFISGPPSQAFVPELLPGAVDRTNLKPLPKDLVAQVTREFDVIAKELAQAGFVVRRLPLDDHPARSPANSLKYSTTDGRGVVILAKYPHLESPGAKRMADAMVDLWRAAQVWDQNPGPEQRNWLDRSIAALRQIRQEVALEPNPIFDRQAEVYAQAGVKVIGVFDLAWGAGGIHCQTLH